MIKDYMLEGCLTQRHKDAGMWLCLASANKQILNLIKDGSVVESFDANRVTIEKIIDKADQYLY